MRWRWRSKVGAEEYVEVEMEEKSGSKGVG